MKDPRRRPPLNSLIRHLITRPLSGTDAEMEDLVGVLDSAVKADACALLRLHPGSGTGRVLAGKRLGSGPGNLESPGITGLLSGLSSGQIGTARGPFPDDPFLEGEGAGALLLACMDFGAERLVTLSLRRGVEDFTAAEKERFLIVSGVINLMIRSSYDAREHGQHRDIDSLTGLGLYPAFHDTLDKEISRSRRRSGRIAVGILHVAGGGRSEDGESFPADATVLLVAEALVKELRNFDTVIRYSPTEFALILPDIGGGDAEKVMGRVIDSVHCRDGKRSVGLWIGLSCYPEDGTTAERLIETAEAALNLAVKGGAATVTRWKE